MDRSREEKDALQTAHRYHATAHFSRRKLAGGRAYSEVIKLLLTFIGRVLTMWALINGAFR